MRSWIFGDLCSGVRKRLFKRQASPRRKFTDGACFLDFLVVLALKFTKNRVL